MGGTFALPISPNIRCLLWRNICKPPYYHALALVPVVWARVNDFYLVKGTILFQLRIHLPGNNGMSIFHTDFVFQFFAAWIGIGFNSSGEDQITRVCHHAIHRSDARRIGFVMTKHDLAYFNECKFMFP